MSKQYGTAEVQALLAKPARIKQIFTLDDAIFTVSDSCAITLLQNHNAIVIWLNEQKQETGYTIITSSAITGVEMEVESAEKVE